MYLKKCFFFSKSHVFKIMFKKIWITFFFTPNTTLIAKTKTTLNKFIFLIYSDHAGSLWQLGSPGLQNFNLGIAILNPFLVTNF